MELKGCVAVVTGGASGIGRALCQRFAAEGARGIVVADLSESGAQSVATEVKGLAVACDVAVEAQIVELVRRAEAAFGPIDLFVSNAGLATKGGAEAPDADWQLNWDVHVMSHVYAALRSVARNDRVRPRLSAQHGLSSRPAHRDGVGTLFGHQARGRSTRGMAVDPALRGGHSRLVPVPDGCDDEHADRRQPARQLSQTDGRQPRARRRGMREGHPRRAVHGPAAPGGQGVLRLPRQRYGPLDERHAAAQ